MFSEDLILAISPALQAIYRFLLLVMIAPGGLMLFALMSLPVLIEDSRRGIWSSGFFLDSGKTFYIREKRFLFILLSIVMAAVWTHDSNLGISLAGPLGGSLTAMIILKGRFNQITGSSIAAFTALPVSVHMQNNFFSADFDTASRILAALSLLLALSGMMIIVSKNGFKRNDPCRMAASIILASSLCRTISLGYFAQPLAHGLILLMFVIVLNCIIPDIRNLIERFSSHPYIAKLSCFFSDNNIKEDSDLKKADIPAYMLIASALLYLVITGRV